MTNRSTNHLRVVIGSSKYTPHLDRDHLSQAMSMKNASGFLRSRCWKVKHFNRFSINYSSKPNWWQDVCWFTGVQSGQCPQLVRHCYQIWKTTTKLTVEKRSRIIQSRGYRPPKLQGAYGTCNYVDGGFQKWLVYIGKSHLEMDDGWRGIRKPPDLA